MESYRFVIWVAILVFPIIAFLITLPYMIRNYHKYGSIPLLRTLVVYSFVFYLLTAYFMVILPLPSISEVKNLDTAWVELRPFKFIGDLILYSNFSITDPSTYLPALKNSIVYVNLFNLFLTIPFGVYLRYYFKRTWWEVLIYSFLLSLFFEITQITGLYGIYPRPYRLFEVDDLIINTAGGVLGYILTPLFCFIIPSRKRLDEEAYENGQRVSFSRRAIAYLVDYTIFNLVILALKVIFDLELGFGIYSWLYFFYLVFSVCFFNGRTIGKSVVKIKIVSSDGKDARIHQLLARYTFRFILYFKVYDILSFGFEFCNSDLIFTIEVVICILIIIIYLNSIWTIVSQKDQLVYELLSKTKNISTIRYKTREPQNEEDCQEKKLEEECSV